MTALAAWEPACLDAGELTDWRAGTIRACIDCTAAFAAEMRSAGRCNGIPGELTAGVAGDIEEDFPMDQVTRTGRVPVTAAAPCGGCLHAAVCRIRPSLERIAVEASLPVLEDGVTVALSAAVSCAHFAKASKSHHGQQAPASGAKRQLSPEGYAAIVAANQARAERQRAEKGGGAAA